MSARKREVAFFPRRSAAAFRVAAVLALAAIGASLSFAETTYPNRPIRLVAPFAPHIAEVLFLARGTVRNRIVALLGYLNSVQQK